MAPKQNNYIYILEFYYKNVKIEKNVLDKLLWI